MHASIRLPAISPRIRCEIRLVEISLKVYERTMEKVMIFFIETYFADFTYDPERVNRDSTRNQCAFVVIVTMVLILSKMMLANE